MIWPIRLWLDCKEISFEHGTTTYIIYDISTKVAFYV